MTGATTMRRILTTFLGAFAALVLVAGPSAAQPYPPGPNDDCATVTVVTPNARVVICGRDWSPATTVRITRRGSNQIVGSAVVQDDGTWRTEIVIPPDASDEVSFDASGTGASGESREATLRFAVQQAALRDGAEDDGAPRWVALVGAGLGILAIGGLIAVRRRDVEQRSASA